jgi:hypothetical protein
LLNSRFLSGRSGIEDREKQAGTEENGAEVNCELLENVGCLSPEKVLRHAAAEGCAETFVLRTLHQDDEHHQQSGNDQDARKQNNSDV